MNAQAQMLNKETITPWGETSIGQNMQSGRVLNDCIPLPKQNGDTIDSSEWNVPGGNSDWPEMSHDLDGCHDDLSSTRKEFDSLWGETPSTQKLGSESVHQSAGVQFCVMSRDEGTLDPFGQGNDDMFGSGFTDNFCEMSETDLIFRSGLVDEEFKTICVTAEEDDLWSSFTEHNNSATTANQSTVYASCDPFLASQELPKTEPEQEVQKVSTLLKTETQISGNQQELIVEQVPSGQQCNINQHFNFDQDSDTTVFQTEVTRPPLSSNGIVHYDNGKSPSNSMKALSHSPMSKDTEFRETILDESWMTEGDHLESKEVAIDLTVQSVGTEAEHQVTATKVSNRAIPNLQSKMDHSPSASNQELSKLPGDINANVSTNGQLQNFIDFGDAGTSDTKMVVAPPPEFDGFNSLMDSTEMNCTPVITNWEPSKDLLISTNCTSVPGVKVVPGKGNRDRTPSDLERFLNELGDGTVVDEDETTNERIPSDMDSFLNALGDGTVIDEDLGSGTEQTEEHGSLEEDKCTGLNHAADKRRSPRKVDHLLNELGDGTDEKAENGHPSGDFDGLINKSERVDVVGEKMTIKKMSPSDVDRFLDELGDGTRIDEESDSLMAQENHVHPFGKTPSQEEQSIQDTNRAWEQMVKEGSITMTENLLDESGNVNKLSCYGMDSSAGVIANAHEVETEKLDLDDNGNEENTAKSAVMESQTNQTSIKLDLSAKRRSFFGENGNAKDATFQPVIPDRPSPSGASVQHSWALPSVPVFPKLQCSYQRPENFYETKPRAATDSLLSSHALLGLGGDLTVSPDTKSRSASEPPPSSAKTVMLTDKPTGSEKDTSSKPKDSSIEAKSSQLIQALYGPKPVGISSELADEDEKTLYEYERERRDVLAAMKVKRKKRVSWQGGGSQLDEMTSPESEDPLSPSQISNSNKFGYQEGSSDSVTSDLTSKLKPCKPVVHACNHPPNVTEQTIANRLENRGPNLHHQKDSLDTETLPDDFPVKTNVLKSPAESLKSANSNENPFFQSSLRTQASPAEISRTLFNPQNTKTIKTGDETGDGETPIDLQKMRNLWEEKMTFSPSRVADQSAKQNQSRRVFSYEAKAREKQVTNTESSERTSADIPTRVPEVASSDSMPRDLDDDYDHCESYTYEITPHRRIPIQSHWTTESIIEREIKQQTARERELLKEGLIKKRSNQGAVIDVETQVKLQRCESAEKNVDSSESIINREIRLNKEREDAEAKEQARIRKISEGRESSIRNSQNPLKQQVEQTTTHSMQLKPKVTPVKMTEPEISQKAQVVESIPPGPLHETVPVVPVVVVEAKDIKSSKGDQTTKDDQPRRKDSIVQREVRMQKERDEANARERRKALEETKMRRGSLEGSSRSSSGQSTPIRAPPSPTLQSASFTPDKVSISPKASENAPTAVKTPDKSPIVRFGLSSIQSEPYSSYREYQRMLRGRKTSEKTADKPGPIKATETSISSTQSPVFKENNAKKPAPQRTPSPLFRRVPSSSPVTPRPPSPQPLYQGVSTSVSTITEPVTSQDVPDSTADAKLETAIKLEIRLAEEREEQLRKQRSAFQKSTTRKKAIDSDVDINVVILERPQVTKRSQVTEWSQAAERSLVIGESQSKNFSETDEGPRRVRETPVERDIRLAEEREMMLRKERGLSPKPTSNTSTNTSAHTDTNRPSSPRNSRDQTDSAYYLKTVNYYIKKEFEEERRREVMLKREGKIKTVSQYESETSTTTHAEETLSPVKQSRDAETLIEREIRLQQEREDQYRKEKGLKPPTASVVVHGGGSVGAARGGRVNVEEGVTMEEEVTAKTEAPKYRPQRRSLNLAQQWEEMFK